MKRLFSLCLAGIMIVSAIPMVYATHDYQQGTQVEYVANSDTNREYTITVPALLNPGQEGTVTLKGKWASNEVIKVTADKTVELTNSINANDKHVLDITFLGIEKAGDNTAERTYTEKVSVENMPANALFGTWSGKFNYNVIHSDVAQKAEIGVQATDKDGNDLNAKSYVINGTEKDQLLSELQNSDLIDNAEEVDALIEVKSDDFEDLADTTFDVSSIAQPGDKVVILHYNEETREWEYISEETVNSEGKVNADFSSYSPVAFIVIKEDGTIIPIGVPFYYNTWYRNTENNIAIALTEDGICFVETPDSIAGTPIDAFIENNTIYSAGDVVGEVVDAYTINTFNFATNDYTAGYITYVCDPINDEPITSYFTAELPNNFTISYINNEHTTWEDFISSKYNRALTTVSDGIEQIEIRHKAFLILNNYVYIDIDGIAPLELNGTKVKATDNIIHKESYYCNAEEADATNKWLHIGDEYGDGFLFMPGMTWGQWLNTTYNGHYGIQMFADDEGYITYNGKRIYPKDQPNKLAHINDDIIIANVYLLVE